MYKGKRMQYRRLGKQKLFGIRWRRDIFSEKVRIELKAKAWVRGRFAGVSQNNFQAEANTSAKSEGPHNERKPKNVKQNEKEDC